jgi:hypothetical protein
MLILSKKSRSGVMKVTRSHRVARVSRGVCLNDVLNFICNADRRNLRIVENVLAAECAKRLGGLKLADIPIENAEMFILTSNNKEFARLEQAVTDRRRVAV